MTCKADTKQIVLEVEGTQIRAVRCEKCNTEGAFRSPRAKTKAALLEIAKGEKQKPAPKRRSRKAASPSPEEVFQQLIDSVDLSTATRYNMKAPLEEGDVIDHPTFGIGIVTARTDVKKARVTFETGVRVLVCNRA
jgi:hypothetical protein